MTNFDLIKPVITLARTLARTCYTSPLSSESCNFLVDKIRDERRLTYQNLSIIIIDEISLVDSDMLFKLDLRLREVNMDDRIFGGVSLFVFGDLLQMRPVKGSYIFQKPVSKEY